MRLNRPLAAVKVASVTALAGAACAMWASPAGAATASTAKYATTTVVSVPKTGYTHTNITLSATEKGRGGNPTGTVTFWVGTRRLCHGSLYRRKTSCKAQFFTPGTKTVTARYSGNALHKPSSGKATIKVSNKPATGGGGPVATTTTITNPPNAQWAKEQPGTTYNLVATVTAANGTVPTGTVDFIPLPPAAAEPNVECPAAPLENVDGKATATCQIAVPTGVWGFTLYEAKFAPANPAQYATSGDGGTYGGEFKVIDADITTTTLTFAAGATAGNPTTLTATVTDEPEKALADAGGGPDLVTFSIGGAAIAGCTNVAVTDPSDGPDNVATCSYTPATAGNVTITATYAGDDYADGSSDTETLTVS
jgi:Bacterial Ig-like domain (group 3)